MGDCGKAAREWKSLPGNRKVESVREERNKWHFMQRNIIIAEQIVQFYDTISQEPLSLPAGVKLLNPFCGEQKDLVKKAVTIFYQKYYKDTKPRRLIVGSTPARRGSAVTGVPFADAAHLYEETGVRIENFQVNRASSDFLYEVITKYGGCEKFYGDFYMSFVCPFGLVKTNAKGKEVNCNYYENEALQKALSPFIVHALQQQLAFGLDTSVCYCIGSGENYKFLQKMNDEHKFFKALIPLEHPRYIMQYHSKQKKDYLEKYIKYFTKV